VQSGGAAGTSPQEYQTIIQGLSSKPDLIFFAGYASDGLRLGQALDTIGDKTTPVLSDDAFYDPAEFIAYGNVYKGRYSFTGYFYPDQGSLFPSTSNGAKAIANMESEYATNFHAPGKPNGYGFARVPSEAALFYDAVKLTAQSIASAGPGVTRSSLRDALAKVKYQGMAGQVRFNETPPPPTDPNALGIGDPIDKALLVMHLDKLGHTHPDKILGRFE
jgi:ABC-type branched-subunit amino acid transport system substrate-binding protein